MLAMRGIAQLAKFPIEEPLSCSMQDHSSKYVCLLFHYIRYVPPLFGFNSRDYYQLACRHVITRLMLRPINN